MRGKGIEAGSGFSPTFNEQRWHTEQVEWALGSEHSVQAVWAGNLGPVVALFAEAPVKAASCY